MSGVKNQLKREDQTPEELAEFKRYWQAFKEEGEEEAADRRQTKESSDYFRVIDISQELGDDSSDVDSEVVAKLPEDTQE